MRMSSFPSTLRFSLFTSCYLGLAGCHPHALSPDTESFAGGPPKRGSSQTNPTPALTYGMTDVQWSNYQRDKEALLSRAARQYQDALQHPPANETQLPNYDAGLGHPKPLGRNFYEMYKHYPFYLLCTYDVYEHQYDQSDERKWMEQALLQVRSLGRERFPPVKWLAVVIFNRADATEGASFERPFRAGAIFKADDVFNPESNLLKLVADSAIERHLIEEDPEQPTPGEQQRWILVERYAATNNSEGGVTPYILKKGHN
jgi:hypothetical protein